MANIKKDLEDIGLSDKEAAVYVASLELGQSPVQKIATQANIKRATAYVIIESLINKGLMSSVEQGKKTYYVAEDPENLKRLIQKQRSELDENEKRAKELIPELELLFKTTGERPVVRFFEGVEGLETIRKDFTLAQYSETKSFTSLDSLFKLFPHQSEITGLRVKRKIQSKIIYTHHKGPVPQDTNPAEFREARWIPGKLFNFDGDITIYGDKVSITSFIKKPIAILIENNNVAQTLSALFDLAWIGSEKMSEGIDKKQ